MGKTWGSELINAPVTSICQHKPISNLDARMQMTSTHPFLEEAQHVQHPPSRPPSTWTVSSASPRSLRPSTRRTCATTLATSAYRWWSFAKPAGVDEPAVPAAAEEVEGSGARWMWIEPTSVDSSFGQKRGAPYDARPGIARSCHRKAGGGVSLP